MRGLALLAILPADMAALAGAQPRLSTVSAAAAYRRVQVIRLENQEIP